MNRRTIVRQGERYGRLTVIAPAPDRVAADKHRMWRVQCECGMEKMVRQANLVAGTTVSCGCKRAARMDRHRPTYWSWMAMRRRCSDPNFSAYANYGGRGIAVCREWDDVATGYERFVRDMGERPEGMTLDRRDPNDSYSSATCRWSPKRVQEWNKRGREMHEDDAREEAYWVEQERQYLAGDDV